MYEVAFYQALKSINVSDEAAANLVDQLGRHLDDEMAQTTKNLEARIDGLKLLLTVSSTLQAVIGLALATAPVWTKLLA